MKKLLLATIAVLTVFAGCKKDEEETITRIEFTEGETTNMFVGDEMQLHIKYYPEHLKAPHGSKWSSSNSSVASVGFSGIVYGESVGEAVITITTNNNISASCRVIVNPIEVNWIPNFKLDDYEVLVGDIIQLKPTFINGTFDKSLCKLVYTSTNEAVVKVGDDGQIEAVGAGECQIKAEIVGTEVSVVKNEVSAVCNVKVLPNEISKITLNNDELNIEQGETFKFIAEIEPEIYPDKTVTWVSSDENVATIGADGTLTGINIGECTITAISSNDKVKAECKVKVNPISVKVLELDKTSVKILIGSTETLLANVSPDNAANKNITWASSNESIATVDNGIVTGVAAGTAIITVTTEDGSLQQSCEVTVGGVNIFMTSTAWGGVLWVGSFEQKNYTLENDNDVDVYVKSISISGYTSSINEIVSAKSSLTKSYTTTYNQYDVKWIVEYNGVEYIVETDK